MKIITRAVMDWDGNILEEDSYDYDGPVAKADVGSVIGGALGLVGSAMEPDEITSKTEPWGPAQPYLRDILGDAETAYGQPRSFFPAQTFAPMTPQEQQGLGQQYAYAQGLMPFQVGQAQGAWQSALGAPDVANNPYVQGQIDAVQNRLNRNLQENLMPSAGDAALRAGGYGGSRQGIAEGIAQRGTQEAIGDAARRIQGQAYGQGLQAQQGALGMAGNVLGLGLLPGQTGINIGQQMRGEAQRYLDESMARQAFGQDVPWDQLSRYGGIVQPLAGLGGTASSMNPYKSNPIASAMGGAMSGGALGKQLGLTDMFSQLNTPAQSAPLPSNWANFIV